MEYFELILAAANKLSELDRQTDQCMPANCLAACLQTLIQTQPDVPQRLLVRVVVRLDVLELEQDMARLKFLGIRAPQVDLRHDLIVCMVSARLVPDVRAHN